MVCRLGAEQGCRTGVRTRRRRGCRKVQGRGVREGSAAAAVVRAWQIAHRVPLCRRQPGVLLTTWFAAGWQAHPVGAGQTRFLQDRARCIVHWYFPQTALGKVCTGVVFFPKGTSVHWPRLKLCAQVRDVPSLHDQCVTEQRYVRGAMTRSLIYTQVSACMLCGCACACMHACLSGLEAQLAPWARLECTCLYWREREQFGSRFHLLNVWL